MRKLTFEEMERITEDDLEWFFCYSEADCGIKSNWSSMINTACFGASDVFHDYSNSYIFANVAKHRQIEHVYFALPQQTQNVLFATFGNVDLPASIVKIFKKFSGSAYAPNPSLLFICQKPASKRSSADDQFISKVRLEATQTYHDAVIAYVTEKYQQHKKER